MNKNNLVLGGVILSILIVIYIAFFSGDDEKSKRKQKKSKNISSILLGGGSSGGGVDADGKKIYRNNDVSVLDSDFGRTPGASYEEDPANPNSGAKGEVPINPQTGKPYDEETMAQFEELHKVFPENELIPKRMTPEEKESRRKQEEVWNKAQAAVINGNASTSDVSLHFDHQKKVVEDRLQIVEYLVDAVKEEGPNEERDLKLQQVLRGAKDQLAVIESEKEAAMQKARNSGQ